MAWFFCMVCLFGLLVLKAGRCICVVLNFLCRHRVQKLLCALQVNGKGLKSTSHMQCKGLLGNTGNRFLEVDNFLPH
jgi:hypothetical protein